MLKPVVMFLGLLALGGAVAQPPASRSGWTPARTPDGQPDLQGTWVNFDSTPFEADTSVAQVIRALANGGSGCSNRKICD